MTFARRPDANPAMPASPTITHRARFALQQNSVHLHDLLMCVIELGGEMGNLDCELSDTLASQFFVRHDRLAKVRATFSIDRPPT